MLHVFTCTSVIRKISSSTFPIYDIGKLDTIVCSLSRSFIANAALLFTFASFLINRITRLGRPLLWPVCV